MPLTETERDDITAAMVDLIDRYCGMDPINMPLARELAAEVCRIIEARERGREGLAAAEMPCAWQDVMGERVRQIAVEGWTPEHDDKHDFGQIATAAACYATFTSKIPVGNPLHYWPWGETWWKPTTPRRDLVKSGALILAEIEWLDRAEGSQMRICERGIL